MSEVAGEMVRGHVDTIILLCLVNEDMHTNQIKEEIEKRTNGAYQLKQGTFYSALQRIVKQGFVKEYRTTSDGVRRKFYQLTEKGKIYIDDNKDKWTFSRDMIDILIAAPKSTLVVAQPEKKVQETKTYESSQDDEMSAEDSLESFLNANMVKEVPDEVTTSKQDQTKEPVNKPVETEPKRITKVEPVETTEQKNYKLKYIDLTQSEIYTDIPEKTEEKATEKVVQEEITAEKNNEQISEQKDVNTTAINMEVIEEAVKKAFESVVKAADKKEESTEVKQNETITYEVQAVDTPPVIVENIQNSPASYVVQEVAATDNDEFNDKDEYKETQDYKSVLVQIFKQDSKKDVDENVNPNIIINPKVIEATSTTTTTTTEKIVNTRERKQDFTQTYEEEPEERRVVSKPKKERKELKKQQPTQEIVKHPYYDFSDIQNMADNEGFKIKISSNEVKKDGGRILINKLLFHSALTFFIIILAETLLIYFSTKDIAQLTFTPYAIFLGIVALMPIYTAIVYLFNRDKKVTNITTFKAALELLAIIMLNLILIEIVCCVLTNLDFSNPVLVFRYVVYPVFFIINLPVYLFIKYLKLDKKNYYM